MVLASWPFVTCYSAAIALFGSIAVAAAADAPPRMATFHSLPHLSSRHDSAPSNPATLSFGPVAKALEVIPALYRKGRHLNQDSSYGSLLICVLLPLHLCP
jgi:hypothetical protein